MSRRAQPETGCSADDTQTAGKTKSNQGGAVRPTATRSGPSRTDFERGIKTNRCRSRHICEAPTGLSADPAGRSTYIDPAGRRCTETKQLEFHHVQPFGRGGDHRPENICLSCRAHNALFAERDYGTEVMNRFRTSPSRVSESAAVYTFSNRATLAS